MIQTLIRKCNWLFIIIVIIFFIPYTILNPLLGISAVIVAIIIVYGWLKVKKWWQGLIDPKWVDCTSIKEAEKKGKK